VDALLFGAGDADDDWFRVALPLWLPCEGSGSEASSGLTYDWYEDGIAGEDLCDPGVDDDGKADDDCCVTGLDDESAVEEEEEEEEGDDDDDVGAAVVEVDARTGQHTPGLPCTGAEHWNGC